MKEKKISSPVINRVIVFPIEAKLFAFLSFLLFALLFIATYTLYGLTLIAQSSNKITDNKIPFIRVTQNSLLAMFEGKSALENALAINNYSQIDRVRDKEALLNKSIVLFDLYINALTWGTQSKAFINSAGGLNFAEWQRLNLGRSFITQPPSYEQAQLAGAVDIYFGGFANNALRAIANHKKSLRLVSEESDDQKTLQKTQNNAQIFTHNALQFSNLAIDNLSKMVRISDTEILQNSSQIETIQYEVERNVFFIFSAAFLLSLLISYFFTKQNIIQPLEALTKAAQKISEGDLTSRVYIDNRDELGLLGSIFNEMADNLADYTLNLEQNVGERTKEISQTNKHLEEVVQELNVTSKILVRRDIELTEANDRLQELDAIKSDFVSIAAHQLRTPLTGIRWSYHTLLERETGALNSEQKRIVDDGLKATIYLIGLITDLLNIARIEEGRFGFTITKKSIAPLMDTMISQYTEKAKEKGVALVANVSPALPDVKIDEEKMRIVFDNLLGNALKYTPPGGTIKIIASAMDKKVSISISDSGIGIPEDQMRRLFSKFFRADNALRSETSGTGLGLYVTKNIIERLGGSIFVESKENQGTTFTLYIPT